MEIIREYADASMNLDALENELINELHRILGLKQYNVKDICCEMNTETNCVKQYIVIHLRGENVFDSENIAKINGLSIITPNKLVFEVGAINL